MKKLTRKQQHAKLLRDNRHRYDDMLAEQGGGCAICGAPPTNRRLAMDHDHREMKIRGLLCFQCNRVIKSFMTLDWFESAVKYMRKSK